MVCVRCFTYNHEPYILDALKGFAMQQVSFPVVFVVVDDASTDNTASVIRHFVYDNLNFEDKTVAYKKETDFAHVFFARHKTNENSYFAVLLLKANHYSQKKPKMPYLAEWMGNAKYIALCEGDDYWIAPEKLQVQVDFMEEHPQHSLCFCAHKLLFPNGTIQESNRYEENIDQCPMEDIILGGGGYMVTNSILYRKSMYVPYSTWAVGCPIGDLPLMLTLANKGKVGYLTDVMCVYRIAANGSWSQRMSADRKKRRHHYQSIIKMWHQFDEWSDGKYHEAVVKKIRKNMLNHYISELNRLLKRILNK